MTTRIALLRAVNVGGHAMIEMAKLRAFLTALGFAEPRTLLQSGNVVFSGGSGDDAALERKLEREAVKRLGLQTEVFVRGAGEWRRLIADNPFHDEAERDPGRLHLVTYPDGIGRSKLTIASRSGSARARRAATGTRCANSTLSRALTRLGGRAPRRRVCLARGGIEPAWKTTLRSRAGTTGCCPSSRTNG
jgi:uncharacterized protein (DUF1697 family)